MVKCKTIDIMVPADAEIVIEGYLNTEYIEPEGPFGESHGYMHPRQLNPFMDVTAITHRKDAIYTSWLSQLTPSESSVIRKIGYDRLDAGPSARRMPHHQRAARGNARAADQHL